MPACSKKDGDCESCMSQTKYIWIDCGPVAVTDVVPRNLTEERGLDPL